MVHKIAAAAIKVIHGVFPRGPVSALLWFIYLFPFYPVFSPNLISALS